MTPDELLEAMMDASRELQRRVDEHARLVDEDGAAEEIAALAEATAYIATSGTVAERQAHVVKATHEERRRAHYAKGLRETNKLAIQSAMARLSALQSAVSAMREEMRLSRIGDGP